MGIVLPDPGPDQFRSTAIRVLRALATVIVVAFIPSALDAQAATVLDLAPTCPACELTLEEVLFLSTEREEVGPINYVAGKTVDGQGRFWVSYGHAAVPQVFSPDGALIGNIGRQGEGPGEFVAATLLLPVGDSVLIFDQVLQRMTVMGPDLRATRTFRLQGDFRSGAIITWPKAVLNGIVSTPESAGRPYHIVNLATGEVEVSFGGNSAGNVSAMSQRLLRGHVGVAPDRRSIWTAGHAEFKVQRWTPDGELVATYEASPDWFPPAQGRPGMGSPSSPPIPWIADMVVTDRGVWLAIRAPATTWREAWVGVGSQSPHGAAGPTHEALPDPDLLYQGKLVLLDPATVRVVNSWDIDLSALGGGTLPDGVSGLVGLREFFPALSIRRFHVEGW
jgi:hypothetical protein